MSKLISLRHAATEGISRLRLPRWKEPFDHIEITLLKEHSYGPWVKLYCPANQALNGRDPVELIITDFSMNAEEWEPYTGPRPESEEYKEKAKSHANLQSSSGSAY